MKKINIDLNSHINWVIDAHMNHAKSVKDSVRFFDNRTPYFIHPIWCAMTMLTETRIREHLRWNGAVALLYHDVIEDTTKKLPKTLPVSVKKLVEGMTFSGGIGEEMRTVWSRGNGVILLKLYDKVSNLLDAVWMKEGELRVYKKYTRDLLKTVRSEYGDLNICRIAESVLAK